MIRYAMRCAGGHAFDSWFASGAEFDRLQAGGLLGCAICGGSSVDKDLMAPRVKGSVASSDPSEAAPPSLTEPASPAEQALTDMRRKIEAASENVGRNFAAEARRIHEGEAVARPIIGEACPAEARALIEDGIPIAPLPWSSRKSN